MRCVIIDDEPLAIDVIENYVNQVGGLEIVAKCTNPLEAITILKNIDTKTKHKLFQADIVLAKNLQKYTIAQLQEKTELSEKQIKKILNELSLVLT